MGFISLQTRPFHLRKKTLPNGAAFLQLGAAQNVTQTLTYYWVRLICKGLWATEKHEHFGVGYAFASLTDAFRRELGLNAQSNEDILKLTYTRSMGIFLSVQLNFNSSSTPVKCLIARVLGRYP